MRQRIALLGSTGSIGEQTLDVVRRYGERFEINTLTANKNWKRLIEQALEFMPDSVVIADNTFYNNVKEALSDYPIKVYAGKEALEQIVTSSEVDVVVNALVGYAGMFPSVAAVKACKRLALANKESLVVGGSIIMRMAAENNIPIVPIDSEHSAIFQCLIGETSAPDRLIITASGGPFLDTPVNELENVTVEQALKHPNWSMGAKITIDSATLVNKGFEVIEAHWLFGMPVDKIDVIVHPQSVIHSMVEFNDGAIKAQLGTPDMHLPIQYALIFPERIKCGEERFDFSRHPNLTFRQVDYEKFPLLSTAYECLRKGGNSCCIMNAANEVAVKSFLDKKIKYTDIARIIEGTLERSDLIETPELDDLAFSNDQARMTAQCLVERLNA